jgi:hypothetical protein
VGLSKKSVRALVLSIGLSFSVPLESQAFSDADEKKVIQQLERIQTTQADSQASMSQKFSQLGEKVSQVDFKLNVLYGGVGSALLIINGIAGLGQGFEAIDTITKRIQRKDKE